MDEMGWFQKSSMPSMFRLKKTDSEGFAMQTKMIWSHDAAPDLDLQ